MIGMVGTELGRCAAVPSRPFRKVDWTEYVEDFSFFKTKKLNNWGERRAQSSTTVTLIYYIYIYT